MDGEVRKVAMVGLGRMGTGIARNILKAGFELTVFNRSPEKMRPLVDVGARACASPREAAEGTDIVVSCLFDDASVFEMLSGGDGLLTGLSPNAIHVGATTISPQGVDKLAEMHRTHGSRYVAGPVLGRPDVAAAGSLTTLVAGEPSAVARAEPVIKSYASTMINVGERHGMANSLKLIMNFMFSAIIELIGEVRVFAEKSGVDQELTLALVSGVFGQQGIKGYAKRIFDRNFDEVGFDLGMATKDVHLIAQAAEAVQAPLSFGAVLSEKVVAAAANGLQSKDWAAITEITRLNAGLR